MRALAAFLDRLAMAWLRSSARVAALETELKPARGVVEAARFLADPGPLVDACTAANSSVPWVRAETALRKALAAYDEARVDARRSIEKGYGMSIRKKRFIVLDNNAILDQKTGRHLFVGHDPNYPQPFADILEEFESRLKAIETAVCGPKKDET